ncbi:hypothetical protein [Flavobacterium tegetincola]|uniref:hypothetical protein n=1 Tax=Flavobacterium tegetincola TaxID=150172 RepID=UPI00041B493C|nr:hypothetical protein [Flavobacterium tegetincola]
MKKLLLSALLSLSTLFSNAQCYENLKFGGTHTIGLKSDGTLWGWGMADWGQLANTNFTQPNPGQITSITNIQSYYVGVINTFVIKIDGTLWGAGSNLNGSLGVNATAQYFKTFQQITTANSQGFVAFGERTMNPVLNGTDYMPSTLMELS